jgi:hypothetical protein
MPGREGRPGDVGEPGIVGRTVMPFNRVYRATGILATAHRAFNNTPDQSGPGRSTLSGSPDDTGDTLSLALGVRRAVGIKDVKRPRQRTCLLWARANTLPRVGHTLPVMDILMTGMNPHINVTTGLGGLGLVHVLRIIHYRAGGINVKALRRGGLSVARHYS